MRTMTRPVAKHIGFPYFKKGALNRVQKISQPNVRKNLYSPVIIELHPLNTAKV
jgi:hypothetical protein